MFVTSVFLRFSLVTIRVVNLPERTETGLITGSKQTLLQQLVIG